MSDRPTDLFSHSRLTRRELMRGALVAGGALSVPSLLAACGGGGDATGGETGTGGSRGGRLRAGVVGGGNAETLDAHGAVSKSDIARVKNLYDRLTDTSPDGSTTMMLAESFEPNQTGDVWTLRLKEGVVFHNGQDLTADDVIFSFQRILDPRQELQGAADLGMIDRKRMKKIDARTVEFTLLAPYADLPTATSQRAVSIIPAGTEDFTNPVGTGAFKYESFDVGQRSVFVRNENYWQEGKPYLDELEIVSTNDPQARVNGLLAGQFDAIEFVELAQAASLSENSEVKLLETETGHWVPITIPVTQKPFDDPRVREALRLIPDRQAIIDQALQGYGFIGNDLFSPFDPMYADDIPQRDQDLERAQALLKEAGQEGLTFDLHSSTAAGGMLESALVYAEQAKGAGVTVNVKKGPADSYYNDFYLKGLVAQSDWNVRPLGVQIAQSNLSNSPYNETEWRRRDFDRLALEASATLDENRRGELYREVQQILWDEGGYIIWGFANFLDAHRANVSGIEPHVFSPLGYYGFENASIT